MIPLFTSSGNLPQGVHHATWDDFVQCFGTTPHRQRLIGRLLEALRCFQKAGCTKVYVDGSFVTRKDVPSDFDVCWDEVGVDFTILRRVEPVFFDLKNKRATQKAKYLGEFFPSTAPADSLGSVFLDFFQTDKNTGEAKGIVALELRGLP